MTLNIQGLKAAIYLTHDLGDPACMKGLASSSLSYVLQLGHLGWGTNFQDVFLTHSVGHLSISPSLSLHMPSHLPGPLQGLGPLKACSLGSHTSYLGVLRDRKWKIPGWLNARPGNDTVLLLPCSVG